jgi:hypothetical protein
MISLTRMQMLIGLAKKFGGLRQVRSARASSEFMMQFQY